MAWDPDSGSLDRATLRRAYADGSLDPVAVAEAVVRRLARRRDDKVWISRFDDAAILGRARALAAGPTDLPLYGLPFAVKDNIDLAGLDTTAACPAFAYRPARSAQVVERLVAAGALPIGKTNLDQFATGLNGTRSPYGTPINPIDAAYLPGGSSSGSAVAVSAGLVSFALGTDTAGSGRIPAAFTNIVGVKPTYGVLSTDGVVPACSSLDCVSIFALTVDDGYAALDAAATAPIAPVASPGALRYAVPRPSDLEFFGDEAAAAAFARALALLDAQGWTRVEIDFAPFRETAQLLYGGPWVAERLAAIERFYADHADALHPVTRTIIAGGARYTAIDVFRGLYRLEALRHKAAPVWRDADVLVVPSAPTIYRLDAFAAEPIEFNNRLGVYSNFVNLLGYAALAVPGPWRDDRLPAGITLIGPGGSDAMLAGIGRVVHAASGVTLGATAQPLPAAEVTPSAAPAPGWVRLAVVGAHLSGLPLNHQLTGRSARLVGARRTAPLYRLHALPGTTPPKPGLVRTLNGSGAAIAVEVWDMPAAAFGGFVDEIAPPLGIGTLVLEDGTAVKGFLAESYACAAAPDVSHHGGWRAFLAAQQAQQIQQ